MMMGILQMVSKLLQILSSKIGFKVVKVLIYWIQKLCFLCVFIGWLNIDLEVKMWPLKPTDLLLVCKNYALAVPRLIENWIMYGQRWNKKMKKFGKEEKIEKFEKNEKNV